MVITCGFWKYRVEPNGMKHIYFLSSDHCERPGIYGDCDPEHSCWGGGINCDGAHDTTTTTQSSEAVECKTDSNYNPSGIADNWLHWYCVASDNVTPISFFDPIPLGTTCTASHPCFKYPVKKDGENITSYSMEYTCDNAVKGTDGKWTWSGKNEGPLDDAAVLTEVTCNADPLLVTSENYNQDGLLLTCTDGDAYIPADNETVFEVPSENECLLLCDMYPTLKLTNDWKDYTNAKGLNEGGRVWFYQWFNSAEDTKKELRTEDCSAIADPADKADCEENHVDKILKCWNAQV